MDTAYVSIFIRPFEKRTYYAVAMSVRLSVRVHLFVLPSVRPRLPDFSSTCFEISIWNLVYTFNRWHDMSSVSCITIESLWPNFPSPSEWTLKKTDKSRSNQFFGNHGLINQDKFFKFGTQVACCILLDISSVFVRILFAEFWRLFLRVFDFSKFCGLFSTCFEISVWN